MNALETWIMLNDLNPQETMNQITDAGLISDHCQSPADVCASDAEKARDWLAEQES